MDIVEVYSMECTPIHKKKDIFEKERQFIILERNKIFERNKKQIREGI